MTPTALFGFPSVEEIVRKVVELFFGALSQALLPDFLRDGTVDAIRWLIAVPNPANGVLWPSVARLESNMAALAFGLLGLTLVLGALRYTLAGVTGAPHPLTALAHTVFAAGAIVAYHWAFANAVALVNVASNQILSWPVVAQGLGRTVKVLFGGALLTGAGSVFLAALALVAIVFAVGLFVMKVGVLMLAAMLYVAGPVAIALYPLPETARLTRAWLTSALVIAVVPLGWCVIFATAGALALDVTSLGGVGTQGTATVVGAKATGVFAGLLMFAFAALWPFKLSRHLGGVKAAFGGGGPARLALGGGAPSGPARVQAAQARLRAGVMAGGAVVGRAAGAAGAPRGGPVGALARRAKAVRSPAPATSTPAAPRSVRERAKRAAGVLRQGPAEVRAAVAAAGARGRDGRGKEAAQRAERPFPAPRTLPAREPAQAPEASQTPGPPRDEARPAPSRPPATEPAAKPTPTDDTNPNRRLAERRPAREEPE